LIRLFEGSAWLLDRLPTALVFAVARLGGWLAFSVMSRIRHNTIANMAVVLGLPDEQPVVRQLARKSVVKFAEYVVDLLCLYRVNKAEVRSRIVSIEGWDHVLASREPGNGVIFVTAHFGNWEVAGLLLGLEYPVTVIQETFPHPQLNEMFRRLRAAKMIGAVQLGKAARPCLRALARNECVGIVIDRPMVGNGVEVDFFGRPTQVPGGAAKLGIRTGAPIVVGGGIRNKDGTYKVIAYPPVYTDEVRAPTADVQGVTQAVMRNVEGMISLQPEQWYMFRTMWPGKSAAERRVGHAIGSQA